MATPADKMKDSAKGLTFRKFKDGDHKHRPWQEEIFKGDHTHKCPTYVHKTPPCQGSCPSGEDIRGWLNIVRGIEKPSGDTPWQEYAFRRSTDANPFPSVMGRVCPAPCEDGCNRNEVEDHVGINSIEQFIGDYALSQKLTFEAGKETGKKVAVVGAGPAGLAAAYQLRRKGHAVTIFDDHPEMGGMMRYGIPGYRTPRDVLDGEMDRIIAMGVEKRMNTRIGKDVSVEQLEKEFDAVLFAIGAQSGRGLPVPNADKATNCISGVAFLSAFNEGRLKAVSGKVVVVGGGDTSIDVASVARRLGKIENINEKDRPENIVLGHTAHDVIDIAKRQGADVLLMSRQPIENMNAAKHEIDDATREGVEIKGSLTPVEVIMGDNGRAKALRVAKLDYSSGKPEVVAGSEFDIECDLIVAAIGQTGNLQGLEQFGNDRGLMEADKHFQMTSRPGFFACGDIIRPHLLTTVIGQASVAAESIDHYLKHEEMVKRPKVDVHHFNLLEKLRETNLEPESFKPEGDEKVRGIDRGLRGTSEQGKAVGGYAIHNYEDRSAAEIIPSTELFLGHFQYEERHRRSESVPDANEVLGHFEERMKGLSEDDAKAEAERCMSCGMCFECDNCVIYCPQDAVHRTPKNESTMGRYVYTDYNRCIGCHICADVCPTGYIKMGMGE
ncbi:MAG: NAD(P)-binding protein [Gammaproteobacteria bacterium]|nr:NAD(P)-binding protein [Gammaproteobacteria bacterium]